MPRATLTAAAAVLALAGTAGSAPAAQRPNFVWLVAEDLTATDLACYGHPLVATPNIDRLAREGVRFARAFATAPVCSATRSAFWTGMYQTSIGAHHHRTHLKKPLPPGVRPFPFDLKEAGYRIIGVDGWGASPKTDLNFATDNFFDSNNLEDSLTHQPFFAYFNFHETHRSFVKKEDGIDPAEVEIPPYYPDHEVTRKDWAAYLDTVEELDGKIGRILAWLDEHGLAENTVVMFFADHGRPHVRGKQWLYDPGIHVPLVIRWPGRLAAGSVDQRLVSLIDLAPTILSAAGRPAPPKMQGRPLFDPASPPRQYIVAARDRCDEAFDRIRCVRDERYKYIRNFFPEIPYWQTSRYKDRNYPVLDLMKRLYDEGKLTEVQARWFAPSKPPEELYDLERDPHEIHNLAGDPAYADVLGRMRRRLDQWLAETHDLGAQPESAEEWRLIWEGRLRKYPDFEPDKWDRRYARIRAELERRGVVGPGPP